MIVRTSQRKCTQAEVRENILRFMEELEHQGVGILGWETSLHYLGHIC